MIFQNFSRIFLAGLIVLLSLSEETFAFVQRPAFHASTAYVSPFSAKIRLEMAGAEGPAVLDRPETIEDVDVDKDNKTEKDEQFSSAGWEIRLFNDPVNKREFVAMCLSTICGKSDTESYQIMMAAHKNGMGVVGLYMFEVAELYYGSLRENGLSVDMVQVDDE
jgi:ATP-dependent Clp protease adapter protein ClpS